MQIRSLQKGRPVSSDLEKNLIINNLYIDLIIIKYFFTLNEFEIVMVFDIECRHGNGVAPSSDGPDKFLLFCF